MKNRPEEGAMTGDRFTLGEPPRTIGDKSQWALRQAVLALHSPDENADAEYRLAITVLQDEPSAAVDAAGRMIEQAETDPMLRWSVVNVIGGMQHGETVKFLHGHAVRDLGQYDPEGGCEQPIDAETLVAVMATHGLEVLAGNGNPDAIEALIDVVATQRERPVREAAAAAALAAQPDLHDKLADILGNDRYLLELEAATADDLVADPDLDDPEGKQERRFTGPKPMDPDRAEKRQRPIARDPSTKIRKD